MFSSFFFYFLLVFQVENDDRQAPEPNMEEIMISRTRPQPIRETGQWTLNCGAYAVDPALWTLHCGHYTVDPGCGQAGSRSGATHLCDVKI